MGEEGGGEGGSGEERGELHPLDWLAGCAGRSVLRGVGVCNGRLPASPRHVSQSQIQLNFNFVPYQRFFALVLILLVQTALKKLDRHLFLGSRAISSLAIFSVLPGK